MQKLQGAQGAVRPFFPRVGVLNLSWFSLHKKVEGDKPNPECVYSWVILVQSAVLISPKWTELAQ